MRASCRIGVSLGLVALSGCGGPQAVEAGAWEVTTTRPARGGAPGTPVVTRHCLSLEAAEQPTLAALTGMSAPNESWSQAVVANGDIALDTLVDTPDRDVRTMPVRVTGSYDRDSFAFVETITFLGYDVRSTFAGRRVGACADAR